MLEVKNLKIHFHTDEGIVYAADGISFSVARGDFIGIVGESGSGKTVTALSILKLLPSPPAVITGEVFFQGEDLLKKSNSQMCAIRGEKISMIFQDPMTALNPTLTAGEQIAEVFRTHKKMSKKDAKDKAVEMLKKVRIPNAHIRYSDYPHQLSGGMRQRVMIAASLACKPSLIIADEPTTALDVTIQAQVINELSDLQKEFSSSVILITHNLGIVAEVCNKVFIMYAGRILEKGTTKDIFFHPIHPYTIGLLKSVPRLDEKEKKRLFSIPGQPPDLTKRLAGCEFYSRCGVSKDICRESAPQWRKVKDNHFVRCHSPQR